MKIKRPMKHLPILAALSLIALACTRPVTVVRPTVPLVMDILADPSSQYNEILKSFDPASSKGVLTVVGDGERSSALAAELAECDRFDNIDAKSSPDGLPDFSGETIACIRDDANAPYSGFLLDGRESVLREIAVRNLLYSLDSLCSIGPYDREKLVVKETSKLVVMASPFAAAYGAFDVDTLCRSLGAAVPVIYPVRSMMLKAMDRCRMSLNLAVLTDVDSLCLDIYKTIFNDALEVRDVPKANCQAFRTDTVSRDGAILQNLLEAYLAEGNTAPIDAVVIDDYSVSADELTASFEEIFNTPSEVNLRYRQLLSRAFFVVEPFSTVAEECYGYMRAHTLFTHRIAYPLSKSFRTVPYTGVEGVSYENDMEFSDSGKYQRNTSDDYTIVAYVL